MEIELITFGWQITELLTHIISLYWIDLITFAKQWKNNTHRKWGADLGHRNGNEGTEKRDHDPSPNQRRRPTILKTHPIERHYPCEQSDRQERNGQCLEQRLGTKLNRNHFFVMDVEAEAVASCARNACTVSWPSHHPSASARCPRWLQLRLPPQRSREAWGDPWERAHQCGQARSDAFTAKCIPSFNTWRRFNVLVSF